MGKIIFIIFLLIASCNTKKKQTTVDIPLTEVTKENLINYFDTTTRVWFVEYAPDSSSMTFIDSITEVKIKIDLK